MSDQEAEGRRPKPNGAVVLTVLGAGFVLGASNAGLASPLAMGLLWAFATTVGSVVVGLLLFWVVEEFVLSPSQMKELSDESSMKLGMFFMLVGAAITWGYLWLSIT